ncbi:MAG: RsmE family RNA methyltransferase, partial [Nitrospirae bacterium]|nr:RsmE family RNA methyltransferase [Nitrospirota bacterium]
ILLIGPEGGFSDTETKMANEKGFTAASLGPRILRTETAALSAISIIQYELGDMG